MNKAKISGVEGTTIQRIILNKNQVSKIISDYLELDAADMIEFNIEERIVGFGMSERSETTFTGITITTIK